MGKTVQNYLLLEPLGQGSYAKVYKAKHIKTGQYFAIKVIQTEKFKDIPKLQQCTVNQINILSQIRNQCQFIVSYVDMLKTANNFYFVYEYCNGGTLDKMIQKQGRLPEPKALKYLQQILQAFKTLTKYNIMHRDLKPQNILLHNGNIKIADFSFCKLLQDKQSLTQTMLGSPIYMAPEVLKGELYTMKADVWSMGVVYYKMLFGRCPYESRSIALLIKLLEKQELEFPGDVRISGASEEFLRRVIVKNSNQRISWDQIFQTYVITQQYELVNKKKRSTQQNQLRSSLRVNNGGYGGMRVSLPGNTAANNLNINNQNQYQNQNVNQSQSQNQLQSPKALYNQYQPNNNSYNINNSTNSTQCSKTLQTSMQYEPMQNFNTKKSPYKFNDPRSSECYNNYNYTTRTYQNQNQNQSIRNDINHNYISPNSRINISQNNTMVSSQQTITADTPKPENPRDRDRNDRQPLSPTFTRTEIFARHHLRCTQITQMILQIFSRQQTYCNYISYFLFKNACREIESLNENLKKESVSDPAVREIRGMVEFQLAGIGRILGSFYQAILEEEREGRVLGDGRPGKNLDQLLSENRQKILRMYIQKLNDSDEDIRLASQVVVYLEDNVLVKRDAYDRMSRQHLYKQMKNKIKE